jgi:hypothetical protein
MERDMEKESIRTAFTIACASEFSYKHHFLPGRIPVWGALSNNTNICGAIDSMNVWYKSPNHRYINDISTRKDGSIPVE